MDSLILPVLAEDDSIDEALRRMAATGSRAIVVRSPGAYTLYRNEAVVKAWAADEPTCAGLVTYEGEPVSVLDMWILPPAAVGIGPLLEEQLDQQKAQLGVLFQPRPEDRMMQVITRHEPKRDEIAIASEVCACGGPIRHLASSPPAAAGSPCVVCGSSYSCW
jgi:hypothetical protein